jgi:hypothetical protein
MNGRLLVCTSATHAGGYGAVITVVELVGVASSFRGRERRSGELDAKQKNEL